MSTNKLTCRDFLQGAASGTVSAALTERCIAGTYTSSTGPPLSFPAFSAKRYYRCKLNFNI